MSEVHIFAIIHAKPDKLDRLKELMSELSASVHGNEDYTNRYMVTERIDGGGTDICVFETYKDKASAEAHGKTEHFGKFFKTLQAEGLGAGPPYIATTKGFAGFDLDRKLIN